MQHPHDLEKQLISAVKSFADSINSGGKVVADMSPLIEVTFRLPLSNLDYWERLIRREFSSVLEYSVRPKRVWSRPSRILTWLDLVSWDGYKREKTLRTITGAVPNSFFFALALRRLNDWVPEVRAAARERLSFIVKASDPAYIVDALCVTLSHWNSWGRAEELEKQALLDVLCTREIGKGLKSKIISSASGPMAALFSQVGRAPVLDEYVGEIAESAIQPSVRAKAYRSQFEGRMVWFAGRKWQWTDIRYCEGRSVPVVSERKLTVAAPFLEVMSKASVDRSSIVRRVAAEFLIREFRILGEESVRLANLFAADKSSAVSEQGRFVLKRFQEAQG